MDYRDALENPPLLAVCDTDRIEVHTNFTGTRRITYTFTLDELEADLPTQSCLRRPSHVLHALFYKPDLLRPDIAGNADAELRLSNARATHERRVMPPAPKLDVRFSDSPDPLKLIVSPADFVSSHEYMMPFVVVTPQPRTKRVTLPPRTAHVSLSLHNTGSAVAENCEITLAGKNIKFTFTELTMKGLKHHDSSRFFPIIRSS